ncbi:hypothetical protein ACGFYV_20210 [Streptomyces sp. NPDC048297]|uniref:AraC-like ligand-binding domain-containing protein n=1 Tax=Streptomyces sp. NPDC048297 TaxID=3365531 RepID=UPI00371AB526
MRRQGIGHAFENLWSLIHFHPGEILMADSVMPHALKREEPEREEPEREEPKRTSSVRLPVEHGCIRILPALPSDGDRQFLYLGLIVQGSAVIDGAGGETVLEPGDIVLCDPRRHYSFGDGCRMTVFRTNRCYLGVSEPELD